jgi:hypothetical protein
MATVTLPNGATYDLNLPFYAQPDSGSFEFIEDVKELNTPVEVKEQTRNSNMERILKTTWTDTSYTGSNYIFTTEYNYIFGSGDIKCFALKGTNEEFIIENK